MSKKKNGQMIQTESDEIKHAKETIINQKKEIVKADNYAEYEAVKQMLNEKYVVINVGSKTTVYHKNRESNMMQSVKDARDYFANKTFIMKSIQDDGSEILEEVNAFDAWFKDPNTKRYESLAFDPSAEYGDMGVEWNTWRGWKYKPSEGDCSIYLGHIKDNVCNGDEMLYEYILDYMAQIIQFPKIKIFHSIAIKGEKGTGKTIFVFMFMKLFGEAAVEISDSEVLTNQFNSILSNKILVYGDESFWSGDRKNRGKLKNLITSNKIRITYKGKDTISLDNYTRFIFTTDQDWAAPVEKGERRWVTLKCGNNKKNNREYFKKMYEQMENGGYGALMKLLTERDISGRDWSVIPLTEAGREDLAFTTIGDNVVAEYLDQYIGGMEFNNVLDMYPSGKIPCSTFIKAVRDYASETKSFTSISPMYVSCKIKEIFGEEGRSVVDKCYGKNVRYYTLGSYSHIEHKINEYCNKDMSI